MNQLATIPRPGSSIARSAAPPPLARPFPGAADQQHAVALFRIGEGDRIDRRVSARALRTACAPGEADTEGWFGVHFDAPLLAAAEAAHGVRFEALPEITDPETLALAAMIHTLTVGEAEPDPQLFEALRHVLLWRLLMLAGQRQRQSEARGGLAPWQARRTADFLAANIERRVPLGELAAIARLSPFHFARAFARTMGMPPYRYQQKLRIARAAELLAASDMRVIEIALAVGYETPQALARVFVQQHGMTPSEWRRQHAQR
jgi:AraC-like DNA-binding protein